MTQSSEGRPEGGYAWAGGATQPVPAGEPAPTTPSHPSPEGGYTAPQGGGYAGPQGGYTSPQRSYPPPAGAPAYSGSADQPTPPSPGASGVPPAAGQSAGPVSYPPGSPFGPGPRPSRRPGWTSVLAVGAGAAVLSSLLTAGLVTALDDDTVATATPSSATSEQTVPGPVTSSDSQAPDWEAVSAAVEPSVVAVQVSAQGGTGEGSGVILNKDGSILTNNHVVASASTVTVVLNDGRGYQARVVGTDPSTDLAVIKIENPPSNLKAATLGSSGAVKVGDHVMAVGNPLGLAGTVPPAIVSALDRPVTTEAESTGQSGGGETVVTNAIQTDAAINPGNSGGALVDAQGRVIGINSSIASLGGSSLGGQSGSIGLGFAIPIDAAKYVASELKDGGPVAHARLGVLPKDGKVTVDGAQREAALLETVENGTPADEAGLQVGDAIIGVDGDRVNSAISLVGQLRERRPGTEVTLQVVRDGKTLDVKATLGTRPQS